MSVGVNITVSVCAPAASTVPAAGEYANDPGTLAVASSCVELSAVPDVMAPGAAQEIVGDPLVTVSTTVAASVLKFVVSDGVKVTESVCGPDKSIVPAAGVYRSVPGKLDEASSCEALSDVPYAIPAGVAQVIVGLALLTVSATLVVAAL